MFADLLFSDLARLIEQMLLAKIKDEVGKKNWIWRILGWRPLD
jgi:hypothetical protein